MLARPALRPSGPALRSARTLNSTTSSSSSRCYTLGAQRPHARTAPIGSPPSSSSPTSPAASSSVTSGSIARLSTSAARRAAEPHSSDSTATAGDPHHDDHYDPPSGWLWGVPPGEKYEKEGWEGLWVYGFFGSLGLGVIAYAFKPDSSIQTWALEEARRRLEAEGILKDEESN